MSSIYSQDSSKSKPGSGFEEKNNELLGFDGFKLNKIHNVTNFNFKVENFERYFIYH